MKIEASVLFGARDEEVDSAPLPISQKRGEESHHAP